MVMQPKQASGDMAQMLAMENRNSSGGCGEVLSIRDIGTSDSQVMIAAMAKMAKPYAPNTGSRNCEPVTAARSTIR